MTADDRTDPVGDDHAELAADLGGYVLGGLSVDEQRRFEAHLATCDRCRDELADLDAIPVLLELARPAPPTPAPDGLPGAPVAAPPPADDPAPTAPAPARSRHWGVLVGAGLALVLVVAIGVGVAALRSGSPRFSTPVALTSAGPAAGPAAGSAAWRAVDAGTVVRLQLTGLEGDGTWYECLWISRQGTKSAGTFRAGSDGTVRVDLTTAAAIYPGWRLEIRAHAPSGPADGVAVLEASS